MITLITTYFEDPYRLKDFIEKEFDERYFSKLIIVDDGSPMQPAETIVRQYPDKNIRLFRVKDDIGFNSHGARNLAMKHVETEWAYMTDIDRKGIGEVAPVLERYVKSAEENEYFNFILKDTGETTHNDYCVKTDSWWRSGGYDEEFVNWHFGDRLFIDRLNRYLKPTTIPFKVNLTRGARTTRFRENCGITTYPDDNTIIHPIIDENTKKTLIDKVGYRNENPDTWIRDNILQFEWEQLI
jgi:glycosyltransferase involved in cell wall biosynthesis